MLQIKDLSTTPLPHLVQCFNKAFAKYHVKMPTDVGYYEQRWRSARADYGASVGVFDNEKMVALMIIGIDYHQEKLTAFNTGTGVIPDYRGRALVDKMYDYALPIFKKLGVEKCSLEVIQANARAIRVYERVGFKIVRNLRCFNGELKYSQSSNNDLRIEKTTFEEILKLKNLNHHFYSWDFVNEGIATSKSIHNYYLVKNPENQNLGFFIFNTKSGIVAQFECLEGNFEQLMAAIAKTYPKVRFINIDERRSDYVEYFLKIGLENNVDQYEMEMLIN